MEQKIYSSEEIKERLAPVFKKYDVQRAILFGSYGKGTATLKSDVDLLVDGGLKGLRFVGLIEDVREALDEKRLIYLMLPTLMLVHKWTVRLK